MRLELLDEFPLGIKVGIIKDKRLLMGHTSILQRLKHCFTCDLPSICICYNYSCLPGKQFFKHRSRLGYYSGADDQVFGIGCALQRTFDFVHSVIAFLNVGIVSSSFMPLR